jgi:hypothetical protein
LPFSSCLVDKSSDFFVFNSPGKASLFVWVLVFYKYNL